MRRRPTFALAAAVAAVCAAAVFLGARNDQPAPAQPTTRTTLKDRGYIGKFEVTVTDPAGSVQEATFTCAGHNQVGGYLAQRGSYKACLTAIADFEVVDYLGTGKRPPADCGAVQQITHAGWRYVVTGDFLGPGDRYGPVHEELMVTTKCDEALWQHMKAMLPES